MQKFNRKTFLSNSLMAAATFTLPAFADLKATGSEKQGHHGGTEAVSRRTGPEIIDTNVNLFHWPFRSLKYQNTAALLEKLRHHRITEAWAGSFESLFFKNIDAVNVRLFEECKNSGDGALVPFGTVNLNWPDWEEDVRRCHEVYRMPGIRIYPIYQTFDFTHSDFPRFLEEIAKRDMILQVAVKMEDARHHHPLIQVRDITIEPLIDAMNRIPEANVQLLHWNRHVRRPMVNRLIEETSVSFDISRIEGNGAVYHYLTGKNWPGVGAGVPVPVERMLFGSHAPYFPVESALLKLFEAPLTVEQITRIMSENARNLYTT